ncbi:5-hydroxytryptamine receptor 1B-like [Saccoglossus kowalevskii]|uniref:5-hydroxytryptamine receptor 1B-like n=1 Tax=Saccoglossus kowalevskii TaxID=10224 RepID=A0ABM0LUC2_SACKO|nr:PREDICTED: 5-hydroxytryptamine receptor 1B-like [Saccoglossus kowalevskii]
MANFSVDLEYGLETPERNYTTGTMIIVILILTLIIITTVSMNLLIIAAFATTKNVRKHTNYFYASLAGTDIAIGLIVMPFMATESLLGYWKFGKWPCLFWLSMDYFTSSTSVFNMTAICIDRYMAIRLPMRYRPMRTHKLIVGMIVTAWIAGFLAEVPATLLWEPITGESIIDYNDTCDVEWVDNVPYTLTSTFVTIVFPFAIMLILYSQIYFIIRKRAKKLGRFRPRKSSSANSNNSSGGSRYLGDYVTSSGDVSAARAAILPDIGKSSFGSSRNTIKTVRYNRVARDKKAATTLGILLGFFFFSWIPWQIISIVNASCGDYCTPVVVYDIALWLQYSNSMVNPFLYILRDTSFKVAVYRIFFKCFCRCRKK